MERLIERDRHGDPQIEIDTERQIWSEKDRHRETDR